LRDRDVSRRGAAIGGVVGPVVFVVAWAVLGARRAGYSPVDDPISRLAAVGAPGRVAMTASLVSLGVGIGAYAPGLRAALPGRAVFAAAATAAASIGVAALPLGAAYGGTPHALAAGTAYLSLAATPLAAARSFRTRGMHRAASLSVAAGVVSATALAASVVSPRGVGLFQRVGLTTGHAWIAVSALWIVLGRRQSA
jgi:hypothetical membrane protein